MSTIPHPDYSRRLDAQVAETLGWSDINFYSSGERLSAVTGRAPFGWRLSVPRYSSSDSTAVRALEAVGCDYEVEKNNGSYRVTIHAPGKFVGEGRSLALAICLALKAAQPSPQPAQ